MVTPEMAPVMVLLALVVWMPSTVSWRPGRAVRR